MDKDFDLVGVTIFQRTEDGKIVFGASAGIPPSTANKFSYGCVIIDTANGKTYINRGSYASPTWNSSSEVTSSEIDPSVIQTSEVSLTAAQIIAMYTTPVELVAAVTGKTIVVDDICLKMTRTATAFSGGGAVELRYTDGSGAKVTADIASTVVTGSVGTVYNINKSIITSLVGVISSPIIITNASGVFADGTGTAVVTTRYHLI